MDYGGMDLREKLASPIVTVVVGESQQEITAHEGVLCGSSKLFRNAMNGKWKESEDRRIFLPDDDPETFRSYLQLCYAGHLKTTKLSAKDRYELWASVYAFAEKHLDTEAKNGVIRKIVEEQAGLWLLPGQTASMVRIIYGATPGPCTIRRLLVDLLTKRSDYDERAVKSSQEALGEMPHEFLEDLSTSLLGFRWPSGAEWGWRQEIRIGLNDYLEKTDDLEVEDAFNYPPRFPRA